MLGKFGPNGKRFGDPSDRELLEGLVELTDELADQAHDKHGVDCLLDAGEAGPANRS